jgi:hypothetical protein
VYGRALPAPCRGAFFSENKGLPDPLKGYSWCHPGAAIHPQPRGRLFSRKWGYHTPLERRTGATRTRLPPPVGGSFVRMGKGAAKPRAATGATQWRAPTAAPRQGGYSLSLRYRLSLFPIVEPPTTAALTAASAFGLGFFGYFGPRSHPGRISQLVTLPPTVATPPMPHSRLATVPQTTVQMV